MMSMLIQYAMIILQVHKDVFDQVLQEWMPDMALMSDDGRVSILRPQVFTTRSQSDLIERGVYRLPCHMITETSVHVCVLCVLVSMTITSA